MPLEALTRIPAGVHRATVTIGPPPGPPPTAYTFDVLLDMRLPLVEFAMPKAVVAGVGGEVYIKGSGFAAPPGGVSFGGSPAMTFDRESDTRIRAAYPALLNGSHDVTVLGLTSNGLIDRQHAAISAVPSGALPAATFTSGGRKYTAIYDDERSALYLANTDNGVIERYVLSGTLWSTGAGVAVSGLRDLMLAPGGRPLALTSNAVVTIDPVTLATSSLATPTFQSTIPNRALGSGIDGEILIARADDTGGTSTNILRYVPSTGAFTEEFFCCLNRYIRSSGDGTVLYATTNSLSVQRYDVRARTYQPGASAPGQRDLSVTRDGTRFLLDATRVFDSAFALLGELTVPDAMTGTLTSDGRRAYVYSSASPLAAQLYAFDLTGPTFSPIAGSPFALPDTVGSEPVMTTSVDGRTVFIAGSSRLIVYPLP